jgi:hypothetical protein
MNVEIEIEAAQFPGQEYIIGIFLAVYASAERADTLPIFLLYSLMYMCFCLCVIFISNDDRKGLCSFIHTIFGLEP